MRWSRPCGTSPGPEWPAYAISAVDVALWDLKARVLGLPLHHLLGAVRDSVPVYGSGGFTTYSQDQLRDQLDGWVGEHSIPRVKIKIGESWGTDLARDLERMRQARTIIGDDVELFVDANGGYRAKQAIRLMNTASDLDVRWFEEPVSSDDLDGLREVRAAVLADVTAGEYGYDLYYFRRMCAAEAVDCLQADVSRCGGITMAAGRRRRRRSWPGDLRALRSASARSRWSPPSLPHWARPVRRRGGTGRFASPCLGQLKASLNYAMRGITHVYRHRDGRSHRDHRCYRLGPAEVASQRQARTPRSDRRRPRRARCSFASPAFSRALSSMRRVATKLRVC